MRLCFQLSVALVALLTAGSVLASATDARRSVRRADALQQRQAEGVSPAATAQLDRTLPGQRLQAPPQLRKGLLAVQAGDVLTKPYERPAESLVPRPEAVSLSDRLLTKTYQRPNSSPEELRLHQEWVRGQMATRLTKTYQRPEPSSP